MGVATAHRAVGICFIDGGQLCESGAGDSV